MVIEYKNRVASLRSLIKKESLDAFFVTNAVNVSYISPFKGHDSMILILESKKYFITDSRYIEDAKETMKGYEITLVKGSTYETLKKIIGRNRLKRVGFESMDLPYEAFRRLKRAINGVKFIPFKNLIGPLRAVKDTTELGLIKRSIACTKDVLKRIMAVAKPGVSEREIVRKAEIYLIERGSRPSFEMIVATTKNSFKPHARPTDARVSKNDLIMVDIGCNIEGYNSDMTRMLVVGKINKELRRIYAIVQAAQERAIRLIRPGARMCDIDLAARGYIRERGFGKYFGHSLGHGTGMEAHELPNISPFSKYSLLPGMVFTVEPAIYIPKLGGVRIEDMVLVTQNGCEVLTR